MPLAKNKRLYVFGFSLLICTIISISLALAATSLRPAQALSVRLDTIKNILAVAGYSEEEMQGMQDQGPSHILGIFHQYFEPELFNASNQTVPISWLEVELESLGLSPKELQEKEAFELLAIFQTKVGLLATQSRKSIEDYDPKLQLLYRYIKDGELRSYIVPVEGYGLWDEIFGYVAIAPDMQTIQGIRFYKHQETPGLGGECSEPWFTNQFKGKKFIDQGQRFVSVSVVKGKAKDLYSGDELLHYVDGISGGTITARGITRLLYEDLGRYNEYFQQLSDYDADASTF